MQPRQEAICGLNASSSGLHAAAGGGHLDVLKYLHANGAVLTLETCAAAVRGCHIPCLQFCVAHNAPLDESLCAAAAVAVCGNESHGLEMLRYMHEVARCPWDARTCTAAASRNSLECLEYAHKHGCPWDIDTTNTAAMWGDSIQYMLEQGCPCDEETCAAVARRGILSRLKLLHERGCPWDERVSRAALRCPYTGCLQYCVKHGCPMDKETMQVYNEYIEEHGHSDDV